MILAESLSKVFADHTAVKNLSFSIQKGEIVGFLGPNGAGKSTTMRILAGYLPPTQGRAEIAGFDVETHPQKARAQLGYLPESVPLYPELRVSEYLQFRARLKNVKNISTEISRVIEKAFLTERKNQIIGTLSKGYRQRVGLADALLGNPPILLLDEPTEGLDPIQIRATRELIRSLSQEHTVLLSTHILPEVEQICKRVILLHKGALSADLVRSTEHNGLWIESGKSSHLHETFLLTFANPFEKTKSILSEFSGISSLQEIDQKSFEVSFSERDKTIDSFLQFIVNHGLQLREMRSTKTSLEEIFIAKTTNEE